jgi:hypothetical protein
MPLWPSLARQHPRLRRSARLARDRTANPVEQPAIRSFAPAPTPKLRPKITRSTASHQLHQHSRRRQIPIAPAALSVPHTPRFRALALFGRRLSERGHGSQLQRPKTCTKAGSCTTANLETQQKLTAPARSLAMTDSIVFFHFPYGLTLFCLRLPGLPLREPFQPCCVPGVCVEVAEVEPEFGARCVVAFPEVVAADPEPPLPPPPPPPANATVAVVASSSVVDRAIVILRNMVLLLW